MENFQYSVQLSDQDWAEFSATADECGLLQASLASGDELLSSDIDQGDSSGSSPPGPLPLLSGQLAPAGSCWQGCEEEDDVASRWLVSRSLCEPALAPGPSQQTLGTSARSRAWPPLGSGATAPGQCSSLPGPASGHEMQRLLQGPVPGPPGEPPRNPESAGCSTTLQRPPDSPGPPPRSPGRKKRRTMGAKGGGRMGTLGPGAAQLSSLPLTEASLDEGLGLAGPKGKGLRAGTAALTAGAGQDRLQTDSRGVPELSTRREPDSMLPAPDCVLEGPAGPLRAPVRTELCPSSTPVKEVHADIAMSKPDVTLSTPASEPQLNMAGSTPTSEPQLDMAGSTPASKTQPNMAGSTPASKTQPDVAGSTPASEPQPDVAGSTPASKTQLNMAGSTPTSEPQLDTDMAGSTPASESKLDMDLPTARLVVKPEDLPTPALVAASPTAPPHSVSEVESYMGVSADAPRANAAAPSPAPAPQAGQQMGGAVREQVTGAPSAEAPGQHSGGPSLGSAPGPRRKKVRFSVATPSPEEPGSRGVLSLRSPVARTAAEGRRGPGTWDAAAVGTHPPQPRILKHLPPPAPSSPGGSGPGMGFAVTLPEAYEFFFCDTIEEGDEGAEEEAVDSQALAQAQWPDMCEFFFRDCGSQRPKSLQGSPAAPAPKAEPVPAPPPGSPVPMSIPEAYEHFFGEDRCGDMLGPSTLLQPHTLEPPRLAPWELRPGPPPKPSPGAAEQLSLVVRQAGELRGPLTSFTFSQKDMCLVFVAFATWAVRTSDLQTPDAWKTVLLANIGTISAIRYFRRQVGQGRSSRSPSPGHSPSSSRSPSPGHSPSS
ncbi:PGC-1 and ERR-induced regulator in muscle protein 1 [Lepus europaeus]|uniref:PGC-1 and ERR-induced regulator in muscle protein 1 n=1 Tax=Lepus europaeus TaxID=9983 RepID=UPI002B45A00A|nr:PGC-1 and ERR-induced regulator in muscle protein 1 [Lepus europaeus]